MFQSLDKNLLSAIEEKEEVDFPIARIIEEDSVDMPGVSVETLPVRNREAEVALRQGLENLEQLPPEEAARKIQKLEAEHGSRRQWVWAQLGQAPLAQALASLSRLASTWV